MRPYRTKRQVALAEWASKPCIIRGLRWAWHRPDGDDGSGHDRNRHYFVGLCWLCLLAATEYLQPMKKVAGSFELSATDLVGHLQCHHLTVLDRAVAEGALAKPKVWDPLLQILSERGAPHERDYIEHLTRAGLDVTRIDGVEVTNEAAAETLAAMRRGVPVIVQGALSDRGWNGRADILRRVEVPSAWGG